MRLCVWCSPKQEEERVVVTLRGVNEHNVSRQSRSQRLTGAKLNFTFSNLKQISPVTPLQSGAIPTVRGTPACWVSPRREQKSSCLTPQLEGIKTAFAPTRRPDSNHFDQSADSSICNSLRHSQMQTDANKNLLISIKGLKWREMKFSFSLAWPSSVICSSAHALDRFFPRSGVLFEIRAEWSVTPDYWRALWMESWCTWCPKIPGIKQQHHSEPKGQMHKSLGRTDVADNIKSILSYCCLWRTGRSRSTYSPKLPVNPIISLVLVQQLEDSSLSDRQSLRVSTLAQLHCLVSQEHWITLIK